MTRRGKITLNITVNKAAKSGKKILEYFVSGKVRSEHDRRENCGSINVLENIWKKES